MEALRMEAGKYGINELRDMYAEAFGIDPEYKYTAEGGEERLGISYREFLLVSLGFVEFDIVSFNREMKSDVFRRTTAKEVEDFLERTDIDVEAQYARVAGSEYGCDQAWRYNFDAFYAWMAAEYEKTGGIKLKKRRAKDDWGPLNAKLYTPKPVHGNDPFKMAACGTLGERAFRYLDGKYDREVKLGRLDPEEWPYKDYINWCITKMNAGELRPYLTRLDLDDRFRPDNAYFSYRPRVPGHHGSGSGAYRKWSYYKGRYGEFFREPIGYPEFVSGIVEREDPYRPGMKMHVKRGTEMDMSNVEFGPVTDKADIERMCRMYFSIDDGQRDFGGIQAFINWCIRDQGYTRYLDYRKVRPGKDGPETAVLDIFTEEGYMMSKGNKAYGIYLRDKGSEAEDEE